MLFPAKRNGKSGYVDSAGEPQTDFRFDFFGCRAFSEGLASVTEGGLAGFIDLQGEYVIEPQFDMAMGFSDGLARVEKGDRKGYIDKSGEFVITLNCYACECFENGIAQIKQTITSRGNFIDKAGTVLFSERNYLLSRYREGMINCSEGKGWGYINIHDQFVVDPIYKHTRPFFEAKAAVAPKRDLAGNPNRKDFFGFINAKGELVIEPRFQGADLRFSEGLCAVWDEDYGYIDEAGELAIPCEFAFCGDFSEGLAVYKLGEGKEKKYGFIDTAGSKAIDAKFDHAESFSNGVAEVIVGDTYEDFRYGLIDRSGDYLWEPKR